MMSLPTVTVGELAIVWAAMAMWRSRCEAGIGGMAWITYYSKISRGHSPGDFGWCAGRTATCVTATPGDGLWALAGCTGFTGGNGEAQKVNRI